LAISFLAALPETFLSAPLCNSRANCAPNPPTIQPSSFNMYSVFPEDLSHLCEGLRPMTNSVFFLR